MSALLISRIYLLVTFEVGSIYEPPLLEWLPLRLYAYHETFINGVPEIWVNFHPLSPLHHVKNCLSTYLIARTVTNLPTPSPLGM
jgi:hypothetical protein